MLSNTPDIILSAEHADMFELRLVLNEETSDINVVSRCNLAAMRKSPAFKGAFSLNADAYDAFITSGLRPMVDSIPSLHAMLDANLGITHGDTE